MLIKHWLAILGVVSASHIALAALPPPLDLTQVAKKPGPVVGEGGICLAWTPRSTKTFVGARGLTCCHDPRLADAKKCMKECPGKVKVPDITEPPVTIVGEGEICLAWKATKKYQCMFHPIPRQFCDPRLADAQKCMKECPGQRQGPKPTEEPVEPKTPKPVGEGGVCQAWTPAEIKTFPCMYSAKGLTCCRDPRLADAQKCMKVCPGDAEVPKPTEKLVEEGGICAAGLKCCRDPRLADAQKCMKACPGEVQPPKVTEQPVKIVRQGGICAAMRSTEKLTTISNFYSL
ncbi:hypothetical protein HGRIS_011830 [Hohenbuehelia grisea]|uniref:Uncharacterized protein n=1 Tax=Hohenbuehelia grisea TaxID=104357 RepID=A0ABR3JWG9_9AGAR